MIIIKFRHDIDPLEFDWDNTIDKCFDGMDLHRALLQGKNLSKSSFVKTSLRGAEFEGADFSYANLDSCCLAVSYGDASNFSNAIITNAILSGAKLTNANLEDADFSNSHIGAKFTNSNLQNTVWVKAIFSGDEFDNANLKNADFSEANFTEATTVGGKKIPVSFKGANLCGADFSTCINIKNAKFKGAIYDDQTKWSQEFNPKRKGAIKV